MAGEDILTYSGQAAIAYQDALNQAKATQDALLRQYGFVAPNASGAYSVEGAQAAFDPNTLFDKATGGIDRARLSSLVGGLGMGGSGRLADVSRAGTTGESDVMAEQVARGFGGEVTSGLTGQRRALAERTAATNLGGAKSEFISALGGALSPISGAYQTLQSAQIQDRLAQEEATAYKSSLSQPVDFTSNQPAPKPSKPDTPGTRLYELKGGYRWMGKKGWQKVKGA